MSSPMGDRDNELQRSNIGRSNSSVRYKQGGTLHKTNKPVNTVATDEIEPLSPSEAQVSATPHPLSPSLDNSPASPKQHRSRSKSPKSHSKSTSQHLTPIRNSPREPLFTPSSRVSGRLALFEDTPRSIRDLPGTLHHQNDDSVEHLIARVGAVSLVKQLSQDLAQRDVEVTRLHRRAEERERLLKRMLLECKVTNMEIENRLKELEKSSYSTSVQDTSFYSGKANDIRDAGLGLHGAGDGLDDSISDAIGHAINASFTKEDEVSTSDLTTNLLQNKSISAAKRIESQSEASNSRPSSQQSKSSTSTGWMSLFRSAKSTNKESNTNQNPKNKSSIPQRETLSVPESPLAAEQRTSLSHDVFRPPPPVLTRSMSSTASLQDDLVRLSKRSGATGESESNNGSTSLSSKALKFVVGGGKPISDRGSATRERASTIGNSPSGAGLGKTTSSIGSPRYNSQDKPSTGISGRASSSRSSISSAFGRAMNTHSNPDIGNGITENRYPNSPPASISDATGNLGPVEMDTILPEESRPPTLVQYNNYGSSEEFLTDRFGFIYDQRRRRRQNEAVAASISRAAMHHQSKALLGHRMSVDGVLRSDNASISSQVSNHLLSRPDTPASMDEQDESQPTKGWQDYLRFSNLKTELLSHTPYAAPITSITTGDEVELNTGERTQQGNFSESIETTQASDQYLAGINTSKVSTADPVKALLDQLTEVHDNLQRDRTAKWNDFLRKVRAERKRNGEAYAAHENRSRSSTMPEDLLADGEIIGVAGLGNKGKVGRAKWHEFRNLVLGGIPVAYRAKIWAECSGASSLRIPGYYDELVNSSFDDPTIVQQIQMDITRTLTDNIFFRKGQGVVKLNEVLLAYARHNPEIGYCQGMNMITANLLLIMPTAEDAFWLLTSIVEKILPEKYYDSSLLTSRADQVVLRQYVAEILPILSAHLDNLSIELEALTFQWFLSVFTDCLSAEALFRVWDVVLCMNDGASFLFQVAVALLKLNEQSLLKCENPAEIYGYINQKMTDHAISIDGLIAASEGLKKMIQRDQIIQRRKEAVEIEERTAREREAIRKGKARKVDSPPQSLKSDRASEKSAKSSSRPASQRSRPPIHTTLPPATDPQDEIQNYGQLEVQTPVPVEDEFMF